MMVGSVSSDILSQYKNISSKLKKRFLRKTNAAEQSDQFASLATQCERCDLPQYAGLSWLAVSKCEASLEHINEEATALIKAGRFFVHAEKNSVVGCGEQLLAGLYCFCEAEKLWGKETPLTASLCLELGNSLKSIAPHHSVAYFEKAIDLLADSPPLQLSALGNLASMKIAVGNYHDALTVFSKMVETVYKITSTPFGAYLDILVRCEVSRVLLILLLRPTPQQISPECAKLFEKYTWIGEPDKKTVMWLSEELFFLLQSLVLSCQSHQIEGVKCLEADLWKCLSEEQRVLLARIVTSISKGES